MTITDLPLGKTRLGLEGYYDMRFVWYHESTISVVKMQAWD